MEYKSGVELSATALWAVDVSTPDIETKSYMRNTLSSESRRRVQAQRPARQLAVVEAGAAPGKPRDPRA